MAAPAPKRRALGGGRGLAALVAGARAKRAEINLMDEEVEDARGAGVGGQIGAATTTTAAATMEKPAPPASQPSATPAAIRPALFYGGSLPRPPLHAGHPLVTPGSAPVLANAAGRGSGIAPSASAAAFAAGGMKTRWSSKERGARQGAGGFASFELYLLQSRCAEEAVPDAYRLSAGPAKAAPREANALEERF